MSIFDALPNVMRRLENDNGTTSVTLKNWYKYQIDDGSYERLKRLRSKRRGEEKRGEDLRREDKKDIYGELQNVRLTKKEYDKIVERLGLDKTNYWISSLDAWLGEGNKKKSHYATILNWDLKEKKKEAESQDYTPARF